MGCQGTASLPSKNKAPAKAAEQSQDQQQQITTESGEATGWTKTEPKAPLWKVAWDSAQLFIDQHGNPLTEMKRPHGTMYQGQKAASRFQAQTGDADKDSGDLNLKTSVTVTSVSYKATLSCDHILYSSKGRQVIQASGNVRVTGPWGSVSGLDEVLATPDLKIFATPDLFPKK